jgi:hypothetical protein
MYLLLVGPVLSTIPRYLGSYGTISRTSMSASFIAGSKAGSISLLMGYKPTLTPQVMKDLPLLDRTEGSDSEYPFPSIRNPNSTILESNETGHYELNQTYPSVLARLLTSTAMAQIQVLNKFQVTLGDIL